MNEKLHSPPETHPLEALRAGERIRFYLQQEFGSRPLGQEYRLPSNKALAKLLGVSPRTVHAVLYELAKTGQVRARRGSGSFWVAQGPRDEAALQAGGLRLLLAAPLVMADGVWDDWEERLSGGIFRGVRAAQGRVTLEGLSREQREAAYLERRLEEVDGVIAYPYSLRAEERPIFQRFEQRRKPVVTAYPAQVGATSNFVCPDFFTACQQVGAAWAAAGRRRLLIMGGHQKALARNVGFQLRLAGLLCGLGGDGARQVGFEVLENAIGFNGSVEAGYETMRRWLHRGEARPEAVFCVNDLMGVGAVLALEEAGLGVPEEVSVIGGTGQDLTGTACPGLSRLRLPMAQVGEALVTMVLERIAREGRALPGVLLPIEFVEGTTTGGLENGLLREALPLGKR